MARTRPRPASSELRAPLSCLHCAPGSEGGLCPGLRGRRAPPAASTPRAVGLNAAPSRDAPRGLVLGCTESTEIAVFSLHPSLFSFFLSKRARRFLVAARDWEDDTYHTYVFL